MSINPSILSPREAACSLGITQELLWSFVRYAPKTKDGRKLHYDPELKGFQVDELDAWDQYLRQPWAESEGPRPPIPPYIISYLTAEGRGQCPICHNGYKLENAHIIPYAESRSHHPHNLIRICTECHSKFDDGIISRSYIEQHKKQLIDEVRQRVTDEAEITTPLFKSLPTPDDIFVGREHDRERIQHLLDVERIVVLHGIGGVGKTQLLINALSTRSEFVLWGDAANFERISDITIALTGDLQRSSVDSNASLEHFIGIIVLDSYEKFLLSNWDIACDFIMNLSRSASNAKIVIVSQTELIGLRPRPAHFHVDTLSDKHIQDIFHQSLIGLSDGLKLEDSHLNWLIQYADGHPLAARIMASLLEYFKDSGHVKERIQAHGIQALQTPLRNAQTTSTALDVCLQVAYGCFSQDQKRLLQYISNFPGGCTLIRAKQWQDKGDFEVNLAEIRRFSFATVEINPILGSEMITQLKIVRLFVRNEWKANHYKEAAEIQFGIAQELGIWAMYIINEKLQGSTSAELQWGLALAEADLPNFFAAMRYVVRFSRPDSGSKNPRMYLPVIVHLGSLSTFFFMKGYVEHGIQFASVSAEANIELEHYESAIEDLAMTASLQHRAYDLKGFSKTIQRLTEIAKKTQENVALAIAEEYLGLLADENGLYTEAIVHYENALKRLESQDNVRAQARHPGLLHHIGIAHERTGNFPIALGYYKRNLNLHRRTNASGNLGSIFHHMGNCYSSLGEIPKAMQHYLKAVKRFYLVGNGQYMNNSLSELGNAIHHHTDMKSIRVQLTPQCVEFALKSLKLEINVFIRNYSTAPGDLRQDPLVPKAFCVLKVISFTEHVNLLSQWSHDIRQVLEEWRNSLVENNRISKKQKTKTPSHRDTIANILWKINDLRLIADALSQGDYDTVDKYLSTIFDPPYVVWSESEADHLRPFEWLKSLRELRKQ